MLSKPGLNSISANFYTARDGLRVLVLKSFCANQSFTSLDEKRSVNKHAIKRLQSQNKKNLNTNFLNDNSLQLNENCQTQKSLQSSLISSFLNTNVMTFQGDTKQKQQYIDLWVLENGQQGEIWSDEKENEQKGKGEEVGDTYQENGWLLFSLLQPNLRLSTTHTHFVLLLSERELKWT